MCVLDVEPLDTIEVSLISPLVNVAITILYYYEEIRDVFVCITLRCCQSHAGVEFELVENIAIDRSSRCAGKFRCKECTYHMHIPYMHAYRPG